MTTRYPLIQGIPLIILLMRYLLVGGPIAEESLTSCFIKREVPMYGLQLPAARRDSFSLYLKKNAR